MFKFPTMKFGVFSFGTQTPAASPVVQINPALAKTGKPARPAAAKKSDSDGKARRMRQTVENNRLL